PVAGATATPSTPCSTASTSAVRCANGCTAFHRAEESARSAAAGLAPALHLLHDLLTDDLHRGIVDIDGHDRHFGQLAACLAFGIDVLPVAGAEEVEVLPVHHPE